MESDSTADQEDPYHNTGTDGQGIGTPGLWAQIGGNAALGPPENNNGFKESANGTTSSAKAEAS
jgi:hypothetical protein